MGSFFTSHDGIGFIPPGCAYEWKNGVTEVTPLPENIQFS